MRKSELDKLTSRVAHLERVFSSLRDQVQMADYGRQHIDWTLRELLNYLEVEPYSTDPQSGIRKKETK